MSMASETTARRPQRSARSQPVYVARAKVNGGWQTIGAAWNFKSGEPGLSIQLNTLPINFDGRFVLLEPLADGEEEPAPPEDPEASRPPPPPRRRSTSGDGKQDDEIPF